MLYFHRNGFLIINRLSIVNQLIIIKVNNHTYILAESMCGC